MILGVGFIGLVILFVVYVFGSLMVVIVDIFFEWLKVVKELGVNVIVVLFISDNVCVFCDLYRLYYILFVFLVVKWVWNVF